LQNANRQIRLTARPDGLAGPEHFDEAIEPVRQPADGEALVETLLVSIDPAMRVWMNEDPGYVPPIALGSVMRAGGIARVVESKVPGLVPGDLVQGRLGWQSHPTLPAAALQKLDATLGDAEAWIGPLGTSALTAYFGMTAVGDLRPGETVVVSGAAGAVGQIACQIAKLNHCRVIGIAGGAEKCAMLTSELGLDAAIDYKATDDIEGAIRNAAPEGIDLYFDNVGGPTLDGAIANMRMGGRITICGRISQTTATELYGVKNLGQAIGKRVRLQGFIVSDFHDQYPEARAWLAGELNAGRLRQRLHILEGLEQAPSGLRMLFEGGNIGKLAIRAAQ
jgi:NADPH-dependent curcumin reductase CurA